MSGQATYQQDKLAKKRVYYTGTDTLLAGYALCYDRDNITATDVNGDALALTSASYGRFLWVEKPAVGNLNDFAGIVCPGSGGTGPCWVDIFEPNGHVLEPFVEESCTAETTLLCVKPASYILGGMGEGPVVGRALQTVDRSSTNGTCQAIMYPIERAWDESFTAGGRTAAQLPTAAIWDNFPLAEMRRNPLFGNLLECDFRRSGEFQAARSFTDASSTIYQGSSAVGTLPLFCTADNEAAEVQWDVPILTTGGNPWAFEARVKGANITVTKAGWFVGLMVPVLPLAGDLIVDGGTLQTEGSLGFQRLESATSALDVTYDKTGQSQNQHAAGWATLVADTYNVVGLYYNGTTIAMYLDGVATGTAISATDIAAADFPSATYMVPTLCMKNAHADDYTFTCDWIRAAIAPA